MNAAHVATAGGMTALIAAVLQWNGHWPPDHDTAFAMAGLVTGLYALVISYLQTRKGKTP